jgi:hypothetical protein
MATQTPASPPARRLRKRLVIPAILLALLLIVFAWLYWRGTTVETAARSPASPADGAITQLLATDRGTFVRCALVVDADAASVWKVVTDYDSQADFLPYASEISSTRLGDGRVRVRGVAHSRIWGDWPFESVVTEKEDPKRGEYTVSWDEEGQCDLEVNRGSWALTRLGEGKTLLAYMLQVEVRGSPQFLIRNIIMNRLPSLLRAVRDEARRRAQGS